MNDAVVSLPRSVFFHWLSRIVSIEKKELIPTFWAASYFFFLLSCLYLIRPLRWSLGIDKAVKPYLAWMFTLTLIVIMGLNPIYGLLTSYKTRKQFVPWIYLFFIVSLLLFFVGFQFHVGATWVIRGFYIWLSVLNLFVVSIFWDFLVDIFTQEQGKRLFGFIALFGTLGAISGSALANFLGYQPFLLLVSAFLLAIALFCAMQLGNSSKKMDHREKMLEETPPGKGSFSGMIRVFSNLYLLLICLYVLFSSVSAALFYRFEYEVVDSQIQVKLLTKQDSYLYAARQDLWINLFTFFLQFGLSKKLIRFLGIGKTLGLLPLVVLAGFFAIGFQFSPTLWWIFGIRVVTRVAEFSFVKPASKLLFTVVSREDKYASQSFIDTFIYRLGDIGTIWMVEALLRKQVQLHQVFLWIVPVWLLWGVLSFLLEKKQKEQAMLPN